ncbi:gibberellin-regulated protein 14-like [Zingiber officinale]|uniref:gibberellin-regulated protein 14-like n=1 Tax=Zingiber officinale TaxID=94328 RepID=UPI001C4CCCAA|nr:gibberellin-regulated protein 14-like [Zingiber officinale]
MALRLAVFLSASLLIIVTAKVASDGEERHFVNDAYAKPPAAAVAPPVGVPPAPAPPAPRLIKDVRECGPACDERCALHSRKNVCGRACVTCCKECKCVPPGTYGHTELCGVCYTEWKTHGNRTKCP